MKLQQQQKSKQLPPTPNQTKNPPGTVRGWEKARLFHCNVEDA